MNQKTQQKNRQIPSSPQQGYICYAPVFERNRFIACIVLAIVAALKILAYLLLYIVSLGAGKIFLCKLKQEGFLVRNCTQGNSDPNICL